jgi:hypothetical protein
MKNDKSGLLSSSVALMLTSSSSPIGVFSSMLVGVGGYRKENIDPNVTIILQYLASV